MDLKNQIDHLKQTDPLLYEFLISIIDRTDDSRNSLDTLLNSLKLPDFGYGHSHVPKGARIFRSTDQNIATGAAGTVITFDTVVFDNDAMFDLATNPTRLTINTPGKYLVGGAVFWDIGGGTRSLQIRANGGTGVVRQKFSIPAAEPANSFVEVATYYQFVKTDYIELVAAQTSGAGLDALDPSAVLWAVLLERARNVGIDTENFVAGDL